MKKFISERFGRASNELSKENASPMIQNQLSKNPISFRNKESDLEDESSDGDDSGDDLKDFIVDDEDDEEEDFEDESNYGSEISESKNLGGAGKVFPDDDDDVVSVEERSIVEILDSDDELDGDFLFPQTRSNDSKNNVTSNVVKTNENRVQQGRYSEDYDIEDYDPEEMYGNSTLGHQANFPYASLETGPSFPNISKHYWTVKDLSKKLGLCPINFNDFTLDKGATNPNSLSTNNSKNTQSLLDAQYEKRREMRETQTSRSSKTTGSNKSSRGRTNYARNDGGETRRKRSFRRRKSYKSSNAGRTQKKSYSSKSFTKVKSESF